MSNNDASPGGFKQTEIGSIPEEWDIVKLGDESVSRLIMGQSPTSDTYNMDGDGLPFFQGKADFGSKHPTATKWCSAPLKIAEASDVLMSVRAPVGDVNLASTQCCIGRGLAAIRAGERSHSEFLFYLLTQEKARIERQGSGTTFKSINKDVLKDFLIHLPLLPEQRAIAHILSKIQAAAQAQAAIAERARELKRALMAKLFTEGLRGEPLKETEIGLMPEGWDVARLGDLATLVGSGVTPRGGASTYLSQGTPLIRSQNVLMNRLSLEDVAYISQEIHQSMSRSVIYPGDVLLNITGASIGRVAVVPTSLPEANVNQHVCRIRLKQGMSSDYLSYYLATRQGQWQIMSSQSGTTRQGLNYQHVRSFLIPVPTLDEQCDIARILQTVDAKIAAAESGQGWRSCSGRCWGS